MKCTHVLSLLRGCSMMGVKVIGTHDGFFHADEALACYMLRKIPEYLNAKIIRTRDPKLLETCDIVVDVGSVYNPSLHQYDHHQKTFQHTMQTLRPEISSKIRLSSAGLIYHHFGESILEAILGKPTDKEVLANIFSFGYFNFIQEIDAIDNGIPMYEVGNPSFTIKTDISSRVAKLHPKWNAEETTCSMALFEKAMCLIGEEFEQCVFEFRDSWWPARSLVQSAINNRFNVHSSGEIIEVHPCPWKSHVFEVEKEQGIEGTIKFAILRDNDSWRTVCVPLTPGNFVLRIPLFKEWQGIRDEELQKKSGVPDAFFVHATGFVGGAKSREGALALAVKTLENFKESNGN